MAEVELEEFEERVSEEEERVIGWRAEGLLRAGYDNGSALELALHLHVDLHRAVDLLRCGCPPATAVRILV